LKIKKPVTFAPDKIKKKKSVTSPEKPKETEVKKSKEKEPQEKQTKALEKKIAKILEKHSIPSEYPLQISDPNHALSTGILSLDLILSGGLFSGRMVTFLGRDSSGKSTLIQECIAAAQRQKALVVHLDMESSAEAGYQGRQGIQAPDVYKLPDGSKGYYYECPETGEELYSFAYDMMKVFPSVDTLNSPPKYLFICDGYESMTSKDVKIDKNPIGTYARMHSRYQKLIRKELRRCGGSWLATNQFRTTGIGSFFVNSEDDAGGWALKYYSDAKVKVSRKKPGADGCPDGVSPMKFNVTRNRMAVPNQIAEARLFVGVGVDKLFDRLQFLTLAGELTYEDGRYVIEGKRYTEKNCRALMAEKEWIVRCRKLRADPAIYSRFFLPKTKKDW